MIEIPESHAYARQAGDMLSGRTVTDVFNATYPHKFTWYTGDPAAYRSLFAGKKVLAAAGYGAFVDLLLEDRVHIALSDGVHIRYCPAGADIPPKYQLLIAFDDDSFLVFTVAMYGGINAFRDTLDNPYYLGALSKPSPLGDGFDAAYFDRLVAGAKPNLSAKAFLATQQRIPGLGNGVLQDILFNARIHSKRKMATLGERELDALFGAEIHAGRNDSGRWPGYGEGSFRQFRRVQGHPLEKYIYGSVPCMRRCTCQGGLSGRGGLLLPALPALEIAPALPGTKVFFKEVRPVSPPKA